MYKSRWWSEKKPLLHGDQVAIPRSRPGDDLTAYFGERLANHFIGRIRFQAKVNQFVVEQLVAERHTGRGNAAGRQRRRQFAASRVGIGSAAGEAVRPRGAARGRAIGGVDDAQRPARGNCDAANSVSSSGCAATRSTRLPAKGREVEAMPSGTRREGAEVPHAARPSPA